MLFLQASCSLLNTHALSPFVLKHIAGFIQFCLLTFALVLKIGSGPLHLLEPSLLFSDLVFDPFGLILILIDFLSHTLIFLFHFPDHSVQLFFLTEGLSPFPFHFFLDLPYFLCSQFGLPLHGHVVFIVGTNLLYFSLQLIFKALYFFDIEHTLSPFFLEGSFEISYIAVSPELFLPIFFEFSLLFVQHILKFLDPVLVDRALPPFIIELALKEVNLVFSKLNLLSSLIELFLFSICILCLLFELIVKFSDCSFISQALLPLAVKDVGQVSEIIFQGVCFVLILINHFEFLSQEVFKFFDQVLVGGALPSLLFNLFFEESHFLIIHIAFPSHVIEPSVELVCLFYFFVQDSLYFLDFPFIYHTLPSLFVEDLPQLLYSAAVFLSDLVVSFYLLQFLLQNPIKFPDRRLIGHAFVSFLFDFALEQVDFSLVFRFSPRQLIQEVYFFIESLLELFALMLVCQTLTPFIFELLLDKFNAIGCLDGVFLEDLLQLSQFLFVCQRLSSLFVDLTLKEQKFVLIKVRLSCQFFNDALQFSFLLPDLVLHIFNVIFGLILFLLLPLKHLDKFLAITIQFVEVSDDLFLVKHRSPAFFFHFSLQSLEGVFVLPGPTFFVSGEIVKTFLFIFNTSQFAVQSFLLSKSLPPFLVGDHPDAIELFLFLFSLTFQLPNDVLGFVVFRLHHFQLVQSFFQLVFIILDLITKLSVLILDRFGRSIDIFHRSLSLLLFCLQLTEEVPDLLFVLKVFGVIIDFGPFDFVCPGALVTQVIFKLVVLFACILLGSHTPFPLLIDLSLDAIHITLSSDPLQLPVSIHEISAVCLDPLQLIVYPSIFLLGLLIVAPYRALAIFQCSVFPSQVFYFSFQSLKGLCVLYIHCFWLPLGSSKSISQFIVFTTVHINFMLHLPKRIVKALSEAHEFADDLIGALVVLTSHFLEDGKEGFDFLDDEGVG